MVRIILPRNIWSGLAFGGALAVALAAVAWAGFTGPNRTTTQEVRDPDNDQWFCDKSGRPRCWFPPGNPCLDAGGSHPSVEAQKGCFPPGLPADSCGCKAATVDQEINLPPATVSGSAACGVPGSAGWCRGGAAINLSASEPLAGEVIEIVEGNPAGLLCDPADAPSISCSWAGSDGNFTLQFWAVSSFGDTSSMSSADWKVDAGPPSITLSVSGGTPGGGGWYRGGTINLWVSGADSVSGVASADVSINGGAWGSSAQVNSDGIHQVGGRIQDAAGNEATTSASIRYDSTPPNVSPDISGTLGREGWYISPVTASASASDSLSGVAELQVSAGGGWQASPLVLAQDGSYSLSYRAVDVAGNETTAGGPTIRIDAHSPESVFIVPPNGSETWVSGIVDLLGRSLDFGSGLRSVEISYDQGSSWNPLELQETEWGDQWDTRQVPNGTYVVLARARDVAGHLESTAKVSLRVDNLPPLVDIPDSWLVGELAPLTVEEKDIGLAGARVLIQSGETVLVTLDYEPDRVPDHVTWEGVMPDGSQAAPGEYGVYASAWDLAGNLGRDSGVIVVPGPVDLPPGETSARSEFVDEIQPESESTIDVPASQPLLIAREPWLWPAIAWFGLLGGLAAAKLSDPRPRALSGLRQELNRIRMSMED